MCNNVWLGKISIPTPRGLLEIPHGMDFQKAQVFKESMEQNWNFYRDIEGEGRRGVQTENLPWRGMDTGKKTMC